MTYAEAGRDIMHAKAGVTTAKDQEKLKEVKGKLHESVPRDKRDKEVKEHMASGAAHLTDTVSGRGAAMQIIHDTLKNKEGSPFIEMGEYKNSHQDAAHEISQAPHFDVEANKWAYQKALDKINEAHSETNAGKVLDPLAKKHMDTTMKLAANHLGHIATKGSNLSPEELEKLEQQWREEHGRFLGPDGKPLSEAEKQRLIREGRMTPDGRPISEEERQRMIREGFLNPDGSPLTEEQKQKLIREGKMTADGRPIFSGAVVLGPDGKPLSEEEKQRLIREGRMTPDGRPISEEERQRMIREGFLNPDGSPLSEEQKQKLIREGKMTADGRPIFSGAAVLGPDGKPLSEEEKQRLIREGRMTPDGRPISEEERQRMIREGFLNPDGSPLSEEQKQKLIREGKMTADGRPIFSGAAGLGPDGKPLSEAEKQRLIREGRMTPDGRPISEEERQRMIREGFLNPDGSPLSEEQKQKLIREGKMTADGRPISEEERQRMIREGFLNPDGSPLTEEQKQKLIREGKMTADGRPISEEERQRMIKDGLLSPDGKPLPKYETEEERLRRLETDPDIQQSMNLLIKEMKQQGDGVLYKQPQTELKYAEGAGWLEKKPKRPIENSVRESCDTARLASKLEKKLGGMMKNNTPPKLKDAMQDAIVEASRTLAENFVADNYKAVAKDVLINGMQKKGNDILVGDKKYPETFFYAAQRLKRAENLDNPETNCNVSKFVSKKLDNAVRSVSVPRKLHGTVKDNIKTASDYLSTNVNKPDEYIDAYVALIDEMEAAGDEPLFDGAIPMTHKEGAEYLKDQTKFKDPSGKQNKLLAMATIPKLVNKIERAKLDGLSKNTANDVATDAAALLVAYIQLEAEKTRLLKMLVSEMDKNYKSTLLRHGAIQRTMGDAVDLLKDKTTADLKTNKYVEPVISRKIQIRLNNLMGCLCPPDPYDGLMADVIADVTQYLALALIDPGAARTKKCKCHKNVFTQCELWCDDILRRVPKSCCSCARKISDHAFDDLLLPEQHVQVSPHMSQAYGPGIDITIRSCPARSHTAKITPCTNVEDCPADPKECKNKSKATTSSTYFVTTIYDRQPVKVEMEQSSGSSEPHNISDSIITFQTNTSIHNSQNVNQYFHIVDRNNLVTTDEEDEEDEHRSHFEQKRTIMFMLSKRNNEDANNYNPRTRRPSSSDQYKHQNKRIKRERDFKYDVDRTLRRIRSQNKADDEFYDYNHHETLDTPISEMREPHRDNGNSLPFRSRIPIPVVRNFHAKVQCPQTTTKTTEYYQPNPHELDRSTSSRHHFTQASNFVASPISPHGGSRISRQQRSISPIDRGLSSEDYHTPTLQKREKYVMRERSPPQNKYTLVDNAVQCKGPIRIRNPTAAMQYKISTIKREKSPNKDKSPIRERNIIPNRTPNQDRNSKSPDPDKNPERKKSVVIDKPLGTHISGQTVVTTDEMKDWHAMMVSIMWNVQAWRDWVQENIDRALNHNVDSDESDDLWNVFSRRILTECLQWMQYNNFSRHLLLRLTERYKDKKITSPDRKHTRTKEYAICQKEMFEIVEMFDRWTEWLSFVIKECDNLMSVSTINDAASRYKLRWDLFRVKIEEYLNEWSKYKTHLLVCWGYKFANLIEAWTPAWQQVGPVWVVSAWGAVPSGAVPAGEFDGHVAWVSRTTYCNRVLPASLIPAYRCCVLYADGDVHHCTKYQVLCNAEACWVQRDTNSPPPGVGAVHAAPDVYIGRVQYRGSHLIGAVSAPHYRCHVVIYGQPFAFNCYELLVSTDDEIYST